MLKKEVTHKVIHPESISKMLLILGILIDHIATSQLDTIKSRVTGVYMILKNTEEQELRRNRLKLRYVLHIIRPQSIFPIFLITFLNSDIDLLDLTKLGNLFQIKDPGNAQS